MRLDRADRQELVGYLAGEGMSTRAIAPIVGVSARQAAYDVDAAGVQSLHTTREPVVIPAPVINLATVDLSTGEIRELDRR